MVSLSARVLVVVLGTGTYLPAAVPASPSPSVGAREGSAPWAVLKVDATGCRGQLFPEEDVGACALLSNIIIWNQSTADLTEGFMSLEETRGLNRCAGNVEVFYFGAWLKAGGYL